MAALHQFKLKSLHWVGSLMAVSYNCFDFLGFQEALKKMRDVDDKIIYALNALPTESFKGQINSGSTCKDLYAKLEQSHTTRHAAITNCITLSATQLKALREQHDAQPNDVETDQKFKAEQRKLRVLQAELNVEDIIKERSYKAFNERCRTFFRTELSHSQT
ncbi:coiled-coil domain-containing protein 58 [Scaptodrosophila lebanonensis]|uniref:Protein MIX23 n=1 Tax=Drosophila lebanonensis TaxID=7225 RepID=A0A6J2TBS9_DROLE|nr:coiled-coil domain-containing protein 58 [Scaptodrosophila lebanonensis]